MKNNSNERGTSTVLIILAIVVATVGSAVGTYLVTSREKEGVSKAKFEDRVSSLESSISELETDVNKSVSETKFDTQLSEIENSISKLRTDIEDLSPKEGVSKDKFNNRVSSLESSISELEGDIGDLKSTVGNITKKKSWHTVKTIARSGFNGSIVGKSETFSINSDRWRILYRADSNSYDSRFAFAVEHAETGDSVSPQLVHGSCPASLTTGSVDVYQSGTFYIDILEMNTNIQTCLMWIQAYY